MSFIQYSPNTGPLNKCIHKSIQKKLQLQSYCDGIEPKGFCLKKFIKYLINTRHIIRYRQFFLFLISFGSQNNPTMKALLSPLYILEHQSSARLNSMPCANSWRRKSWCFFHRPLNPKLCFFFFSYTISKWKKISLTI